MSADSITKTLFLSNLASAPSNISVGLDIGRSFIKAVCLKKENGEISLNNYCIRKTAEDILSAIKQIVNECNSSHARVNVSVSGKYTLVRNIWLPKMSPEELRNSLGYELNQYIPFPADEVFYDAYIWDENTYTRKEKQMRVVLAVAEKNCVNERIAWLKSCGMAPFVVDLDAVSLYNIFQFKRQNEDVSAIVDIGNMKTIVNIIFNNILAFTREIEFGTKKLFDNVSNELSITVEEAEAIVLKGDEKISNALNNFADKLGRDLWNTFEFFQEEEQKDVKRVYLTGGGSLIKGVVEAVSKMADCSVEKWNALDLFRVNLDEKKREEIKNISPLFSIALGLAFRAIDN